MALFSWAKLPREQR